MSRYNTRVHACLTKFIDAQRGWGFRSVLPVPGFRGLRPPRGRPQDPCRGDRRYGGEGGAEERKVSIDESYEDGLVSARLDRRVLSIPPSTHSLWHSVLASPSTWMKDTACDNQPVRFNNSMSNRTACVLLGTLVLDTNYWARNKDVGGTK